MLECGCWRRRRHHARWRGCQPLQACWRAGAAESAGAGARLRGKTHQWPAPTGAKGETSGSRWGRVRGAGQTRVACEGGRRSGCRSAKRASGCLGQQRVLGGKTSVGVLGPTAGAGVLAPSEERGRCCELLKEGLGKWWRYGFKCWWGLGWCARGRALDAANGCWGASERTCY